MPPLKLIKQKLDSRYTDIEKLKLKLAELFPGVGTIIEPKEDDVTIIYVPRLLSDTEKLSVFKELTE